MPLFSKRLSRLLVASGLILLSAFDAVNAQEPPLDPNRIDVQISEGQQAGFEPVSQLAKPENDYPNCAPVPAAWHPPVFYPNNTLYCPTGVVHRDWFREKTVGFFTYKRQRMLEKDYQFRVQNGWQSPCCPPRSCWGHKCDECCDGPGCRKSWSCFGSSDSEQCAPCSNGCNGGCVNLGHETSALDSSNGNLQLVGHEEEGVFSISDQSAPVYAGINQAGFCEVTDSCTQGGCYTYCSGGSRGWLSCPFHGGHRNPYCDYCEQCDQGGPICDCPVCRFKCRLSMPFNELCSCLYDDGPVRGGGGWRREIPKMGLYSVAYPVNPYHFDQRDGRIYAAQGYGHPVAVPLAPNVEHTFNYGWGLPSSRLTPISRMPGSPGVAMPPGVAGPGIYPPPASGTYPQ